MVKSLAPTHGLYEDECCLKRAIAEPLPAGSGTTLLSFRQTLRNFRFCV
ncbi:MAG TPA: hypothetical protein V6D20_07625 [Candidatus Obscuribacterales bacterium]